MFYEPDKRDRSVLPFDAFKAIVAPRPIGWISSLDAEGQINLAPYSFFNGVNSRPPMVMFASEGRKDTASNIEATGEFVCNLATWDLRAAMNATSAPFPHGIDEMQRAGLTPAPCRIVRPPRVAQAPCALECRLLRTVELDALSGQLARCVVVFGQVVGIHIEDRYIVGGRLDTAALHPLARCGYDEYAAVDRLFSMQRPET